MKRLLRVASHEFGKHLRRPGFLISTLMLPIFGIITVFVAGLFEHRPEIPPHLEMLTEVVTDGEPSAKVIGFLDNANLITTTVEMTATHFRAFPNQTAARAALQENQIAAYYVIAEDYRNSGEVTRFAPNLNPFAHDRKDFAVLIRTNLLPGYDPQMLQRVGSQIAIETTRLDPATGEPLPGRNARVYNNLKEDPLPFILPYTLAMLLYFSIFSASGLLMNSVIEEKENRVIEILLTSLAPWQLVGGKILGLGVLGLGQMLFWLGCSMLIFDRNIGGLNIFSALDMPAYVWVLTVLFFLPGYLIYGSVMAGIGAVVNNTREGSILTTLLIVPVMSPMLFLFAIISHPNGATATILSFIPFTASVAMIMRLSLADVPWWQIVLSLTLLVGAVIFSIWLIARIFRATVLLAGAQLTPGAVIRALRAHSA